MLVLTRHNSEKVHIGTKEQYLNGTQTVITVWTFGNPKIQLGLEAPPSTIILRDELVEDYLRKIRNESDSGQ
jgi:sRNA-binding carbon storage regulator CsrA